MSKENIIECACGCGENLTPLDSRGRYRRFLVGHNMRKYHNAEQRKRAASESKKRCSLRYKTRRAESVKIDLIESLGGKCELCGTPFDGSFSSLFDFHHKNKTDKSFTINSNFINKKSLKSIKLEAQKCMLLCANCHRWIHHTLD